MTENEATQLQKGMCATCGAEYVPSPFNTILGLSRDFNAERGPIHGLRHPSTGETGGWYVWCGEYSNADDFFEPVHVGHLVEVCPAAVKFLGLAPGWRFLFEGSYEDVWQDEKLLIV